MNRKSSLKVTDNNDGTFSIEIRRNKEDAAETHDGTAKMINRLLKGASDYPGMKHLARVDDLLGDDAIILHPLSLPQAGAGDVIAGQLAKAILQVVSPGALKQLRNIGLAPGDGKTIEEDVMNRLKGRDKKSDNTLLHHGINTFGRMS